MRCIFRMDNSACRLDTTGQLIQLVNTVLRLVSNGQYWTTLKSVACNKRQMKMLDDHNLGTYI